MIVAATQILKGFYVMIWIQQCPAAVLIVATRRKYSIIIPMAQRKKKKQIETISSKPNQ